MLCNGGKTSTFVRSADSNMDIPVDNPTLHVPPGHNSPQQVHITQGDYVGTAVIVTWVTPHAPGPNKVTYWCENFKKKHKVEGKIGRYTYYNYTSGFIHHANISNLEFDTKYYYELGSGRFKRKFWFETPPKPGLDVPYTFGLIGDIGQTYNSNTTLTHYQNDPRKPKVVLYPGGLSYADTYPLHDNGEPIPFKPFTNRFPTPYRASGSTAPYWYSFKRGPAYVIVMDAYSGFGVGLK
nr:purple acid phosphatase 10 [Quercus suber]